MEFRKRCKNFTEKEKLLLLKVVKQYVDIIDNKKTDSVTVKAKKRAWADLTNKFNAVSETGWRNEKQLHALYDNLKKIAKKNTSNDKTEKYESKDGTICVNTTTIDEKVLEITKVDDLTIEFDPLENNIDTSSLNHNYDTESRDFLVESTDNEEPAEVKRRRSSVAETPEIKNNLTEIKKNSVRNLSTCIIKRKKDKQINEDALTNKKLEILEIQYQQEVMKLEKTRILLDLDIELKRVILENAKLDLELKKNS